MSSDIKKKKERVKKKLGMGLSSLLSKDEELASVIKNKVQDQVKSSSLKIQIPKLSNKEVGKLSILNLKTKNISDQKNNSYTESSFK